MTLKSLEGIQLYREFRDANALLSLGPVSRLLESLVGPTVFFFRRTCFSTEVLTHLGQLLHARICNPFCMRKFIHHDEHMFVRQRYPRSRILRLRGLR